MKTATRGRNKGALYVCLRAPVSKLSAKRLIREAQADGWTDPVCYIDSNETREAFDKLLDDAANRRVKYVLFWSLENFARYGVFEALRVFTKWTQASIKFSSYREATLNTTRSSGKLVSEIISVIVDSYPVVHGRLVRAGQKSGSKKIGRPCKVDPMDVSHMLEDGLTVTDVADHFGVAPSTIYRVIQRED